MSEPVIRKATKRDLATLARLRREFTLENGPIASPDASFDTEFETIVGSGLSDGHWIIWVAEVGGGSSPTHSSVSSTRSRDRHVATVGSGI